MSELDDDPELLRLSRPTPGRRILGWILDRFVMYGPFLAFWLVSYYAVSAAQLYPMPEFRPEWIGRVLDVAPILAIVSLPTLLIVQVVMLVRRGQTIAMAMLGMRIVGTDDRRAGFVRVVLIRQILPDLLFGIPFVGWILLIADFVSLWSADRRCLHDRLSGTKVIFAVSEPGSDDGDQAVRETSALAPVVAVLKRLPLARILTALGVLGAVALAWLLWRKWPPTMSDVEKVCRVAELSRCPTPDEAEAPFSPCELKWLNRSTWTQATIDQVLDAGKGEGRLAWHHYADVLRSAAREAHRDACPTADRLELLRDAFELCSRDGYDRLFIRTDAGRTALRSLMEHREPSAQAKIVRDFAAQVHGPSRCDSADGFDGQVRRADAERSRKKNKVLMGSVTFGSDELPHDAVVVAIRFRLPELQACYDANRPGGPEPLGVVDVRFYISRAGSVEQVGIEKVGPDLGNCLTRTLMTIPFPKLKKRAEVVLSLELG